MYVFLPSMDEQTRAVRQRKRETRLERDSRGSVSHTGRVINEHIHFPDCYKAGTASTIGSVRCGARGVYAMKSLMEMLALGAILICAAGAQGSPQPALRKGVSVQMALADHAVEMRAADAQDATVV